MRTACIVGLFVSTATMLSAQGTDTLPPRLAGHWTVVGPQQTYINPISLTFEGDGRPGPIKVRVTWRGVTCGADDEPSSGTWDGTELRIDTIHRPNVNVQRMNGQCGDGRTTYVLKRKPGEKTFEGEGRATYSPSVATISVAP